MPFKSHVRKFLSFSFFKDLHREPNWAFRKNHYPCVFLPSLQWLEMKCSPNSSAPIESQVSLLALNFPDWKEDQDGGKFLILATKQKLLCRFSFSSWRLFEHVPFVLDAKAWNETIQTNINLEIWFISRFRPSPKKGMPIYFFPS